MDDLQVGDIVTYCRRPGFFQVIEVLDEGRVRFMKVATKGMRMRRERTVGVTNQHFLTEVHRGAEELKQSLRDANPLL